MRNIVSWTIRFRKPSILLVLAVAAGALAPLWRGAHGDAEQASAAAPVSQSDARGTGLPLPRFVSLKSGKVNVRGGPGQDYDLLFTFVRPGLPVEITQEFDTWRKIRDSEGDEGWVYHSLLTGKRTALVAPWAADGSFPAHSSADDGAAVVAYLEPHVVTEVEQCTGSWCLVAVQGLQGWIEQERLWGVYPEERFQD